MTPKFLKVALTAHIISAIGWVGALSAFLVLALAGLVAEDPQTARAAYVANDLITRFAIVPFAFSALITGVIQATGTQWGMFRHYWVLFKIVIAMIAFSVLLMKTASIAYMADAAATLPDDNLRSLKLSLAGHAVGGLLLLLWAAALAVYKPRGQVTDS